MSDYSSTYPTQSPVFAFDAKAGKLDSRISYSRASTGTYLSNEKALNSENLLSNSGSISGSGWSSSSVSRSQSGTFLDGSDAFVITETAATAAHYFQAASSNYFSTTSGDSYTVTLFAKSGTVDGLQIVFGSGQFGTNAYANFDLSNASTSPVTGSSATASITALGSGWVKCVVTATATGGGNSATSFALTNNDINAARFPSYTGSTGSNISVWQCNISSTGETILNSTSGSIHREFAPTLKTAAADAPRFEYAADGQSVGTALGLLVESQSTNYNTKSEDIAGWSTPSNMTVSASAMVAPNGTLTADVLTVSDDTVASGHFAYRASSDGTSGQTVAASFFAKTAGVNHIYFYDANTANAGADSVSIFDLNNGTIGGTNAPNCKMIDCGNGWWRCVSVYTLTGTGTNLRFYTTDNGSTTTYIGNGFDGFALWGVQVEIGVSSESSYIGESVSSTITRASDSCSVALSGILADGQDVTLYAEGDFGDPAVLASNRIGVILQKDSSNYINLYNGSARSGTGYVVNGGVGQAAFTSTVTTGEFKTAISAKPNSFNYASNGLAATEDTSGTVPNYNSLHLGQWYNGTLQMGGTLKRVTLYGQALSSTELAALTSS